MLATIEQIKVSFRRWRQGAVVPDEDQILILNLNYLTTRKMIKSAVIESISKLPDEVSIDEIIERLIIVEKIEKGRQQIKDGKINTEDQSKAKLNTWLS